MSYKSFARPIDHKEYLRIKYGAGEDPQAKPRKKKKDIDELSKGTNFRIYDDDIELKKIKKKKVSDNLDVYFGVEEDRPVVEDIIDERPLAVKNKEKQGSKWKPLAADEEEMTSKDKDRVKKSRSSDGDRNKDSKKSKVSHGLTSAKEMREERKRLKDEEARMFEKLDPKISGKGVKSVYRDKKTGRIRDLEQEAAEAAAKEKEMEAKTAAERQKFKEKTAGIKQVEEAKQRADDEAIEMEKPFARYEDDPDLDNYLRELDKNKELIEDPMFEYFREQRQQKEKEVGLDDKKPKLIYKGSVPPPPNRFNIHPGHRWDGVDRSNGYEQKYFASLAEKEAIKEEAYRWSTEDM